MPKKDGVTKTYSFSRKTVAMLEELCKDEHRTQTNLIESMVIEKFNSLMERRVKNGERQTAD